MQAQDNLEEQGAVASIAHLIQGPVLERNGPLVSSTQPRLAQTQVSSHLRKLQLDTNKSNRKTELQEAARM